MNIAPKFSGAVILDDRSILDALRGSDVVRKATTERNAAVTSFRKTAADKLAKLEADAEVSFPRLRKARESAMAAARSAEIKWRDACATAQRAQQDVSSASHTHSTELAKLEAQLIETASPEIALFLAEMRDLHDATFKVFGFHHEASTNVITGKRTEKTINNKSSVLARQQAIRDAQASAEAMRLDPDQSAVSARLQDLRNNLPDIAGI